MPSLIQGRECNIHLRFTSVDKSSSPIVIKITYCHPEPAWHVAVSAKAGLSKGD